MWLTLKMMWDEVICIRPMLKQFAEGYIGSHSLENSVLPTIKNSFGELFEKLNGSEFFRGRFCKILGSRGKTSSNGKFLHFFHCIWIFEVGDWHSKNSLTSHAILVTLSMQIFVASTIWTTLNNSRKAISCICEWILQRFSWIFAMFTYAKMLQTWSLWVESKSDPEKLHFNFDELINA